MSILDFSLWKIPVPTFRDSYKIQNQPGGKHIKSWIFPMWFSYDFGTGTVAVKSFSRCWPLSTAFFSCRHRKFDENWIFLTLTIIGSWTITTIYSNRRWPDSYMWYCTYEKYKIVFKEEETVFTFEQSRYCQNFTHILKMISKIRICRTRCAASSAKFELIWILI